MRNNLLPVRNPRKLLLSVRGSIGKRYVRFIALRLRRAHQMFDSALTELSVNLINDSAMGELHRRFMGIEGPTDVLTFPLDMDSGNRVLSGEVMICVPEARRQARERGIDVKHELLLYALHGMLHLSGFDDRTDLGFRRMHAKEDEILTRLGVGTVFARPFMPRRGHRRPRAADHRVRRGARG